MIKFNDKGIITGFIKELLHSFNLPIAQIYTNSSILYEGGIYIKDKDVVCYTKKSDKEDTLEFKTLFPYFYDRFEKNYTKNLLIKNQLYDTETHEYLGNYLRFLRDYRQLDLMSMYNCFSNKLITSLDVTLDWSNTEKSVEFKSTQAWKIYAIPVKLMKKYTIAITSDLGVEMFCGLYDDDYITTASTEFQKNTYHKELGTNFNKPFVYDKLCFDDPTALPTDILLHQDVLKLFLKIPYGATSSITILEGDFKNYNDRVLITSIPKDSSEDKTTSKSACINNSIIINFEEGADHNKEYLKPISNLQLLRINSKISHPFADRLLEYLCDNAITNLETVSDNIKRLQYALSEIYGKANAGDKVKYYGQLNGLWDDEYQNNIYALAQQKGLLNKYSDMLGYVDKDIEKAFIFDYEKSFYKE